MGTPSVVMCSCIVYAYTNTLKSLCQPGFSAAETFKDGRRISEAAPKWLEDLEAEGIFENHG
jgi:hypothetical protein